MDKRPTPVPLLSLRRGLGGAIITVCAGVLGRRAVDKLPGLSPSSAVAMMRCRAAQLRR
jgi:hypothetical protein